MTQEQFDKQAFSQYNTSIPYAIQLGKLAVEDQDPFEYLSHCHKKILKYAPKEAQDTLLRIMVNSLFSEIEK